ncbi:unnamed protein product, partial [Closterium sp. NIES-65]
MHAVSTCEHSRVSCSRAHSSLPSHRPSPPLHPALFLWVSRDVSNRGLNGRLPVALSALSRLQSLSVAPPPLPVSRLQSLPVSYCQPRLLSLSVASSPLIRLHSLFVALQPPFTQPTSLSTPPITLHQSLTPLPPHSHALSPPNTTTTPPPPHPSPVPPPPTSSSCALLHPSPLNPSPLST